MAFKVIQPAAYLMFKTLNSMINEPVVVEVVVFIYPVESWVSVLVPKSVVISNIECTDQP